MVATIALKELCGIVYDYIPEAEKTLLLSILSSNRDKTRSVRAVEKEVVKICKNRSIIFDLASSNLLDKCPKWLITSETLMHRKKNNAKNSTVLHKLAELGTLSVIPKGILTTKMLSVLDYSRSNPLHDAANAGNLHKVPLNLITPAVLGAVCDNDTGYVGVMRDNVVALAARRGELHYIAPFLTKQLLLQTNLGIYRFGSSILPCHSDSAITIAAKTNQLGSIPEYLRTEEVLTHKGCKRLAATFRERDPAIIAHETDSDFLSFSALDVAATVGGLEHVPNLELLYQRKNICGQSVLAQAVANGHIESVKRFITPEILDAPCKAVNLENDFDDLTLLELSVLCGNISKVTNVTENTLLMPSKIKGNIGHLLLGWWETNRGQVPAELFTAPVLTSKNNRGEMLVTKLPSIDPLGVEIPETFKHLFSARWLECTAAAIVARNALAPEQATHDVGLF